MCEDVCGYVSLKGIQRKGKRMNRTDTAVLDVESGSLAEEAGIASGDILVAVNGHEIHDILEYKFLTAEYEVTLTVKKPNGDIEEIVIENDYEDLGIVFEEDLLSKPQSCRNKCIFCFIDQLPPGMRKTVYFKDDDTRLSFLQGNYVTLTNLTDEEIDRLIQLRVSPINISVHTTNPKLREFMLCNRFAGNLYERMKKLASNGIYMNCQIVLCPGINDNEELERSLRDMANLGGYVQSISVVPVGVTSYRDGLFPLKTYDKSASMAVVNQVEALQKEFQQSLGTRLVYLSDEFYLNSELPVPHADDYEGFPQIENGVGLVASLREEIEIALGMIENKPRKRCVTVATGEIAYPFIRSMCDLIQQKAPGVSVSVVAIKNKFFGGGVSVTGLICGSDLIQTLKHEEKTDEILISSSMLKAGEDIFLDDVTLEEVQNELGVNIVPTDNDGFVFVEHILGEELEF